MRILLTVTFILLSHAVCANSPVEVVALFKDRAVIRVAGEQEMLQVGETSKNGVYLVRAEAKGAQVRYKNEVYNLNLSNRVSSRFSTPAVASVSLSEDALGQYRTRGLINGRHAVTFLVDTGASAVAMSSRLADQIGLNYYRAEKGPVQTAQGVADAHFMMLDEVSVGGIKVQGVAAMIILGNYPVDVLLGMSYLNKVKMQNENGVLLLTASQ